MRGRRAVLMSTFITIIGTAGAVVLLLAYAMVSSGRMSADGLPYQLLNFGGAATLMINSAYHSAWPSAILNLVWSGIGVWTLSRFVARRATARRHAAEPAPAPAHGQ
ncbi:CBU_0592 family membrane protein [Microbispora bryophytorum]